ncbi:uncharacterized protein BO66DRAFT_395712 [Aspergillus aculeatinus CBS 121060]|uniref:Uncharacterized protein n=1 Tax=Aspergillus aculeatinus CBS 121060 TaxID=1448322 RepID=A0ACD1GUQ3_9EURO|nr:hypothetical protein BO66DRAFT_395712 [Aspergillus aculeatinus CBS 121060]RAH65093.1 hypothetical protein BO66DRAFT_395712 [Aspergillus aculeatinus CBS 121060]
MASAVYYVAFPAGGLIVKALSGTWQWLNTTEYRFGNSRVGAGLLDCFRCGPAKPASRRPTCRHRWDMSYEHDRRSC